MLGNREVGKRRLVESAVRKLRSVVGGLGFDCSSCRAFEPGENFEEGGLSCAIFAGDDETVAGFEREGEITQDPAIAVPLA